VHYQVLKADGTTEYFKMEKLRRSLRRAGATQEEVRTITNKVYERLYDGIRTQEIYRFAFSLLREVEASAATRYSLRRALFGLGPTGFPFERFLARMFTAEGYSTKTGITIPGRCVEHEIDVAAYNDTHSFIAEAKFHARPGLKTDLQVAMYSYARLLDLKNIKICYEDHCGIRDFMLVTNTKFTVTAEKYAACNGLQLLSWDYPKHNNLHDRIQRAGIYPITTLHTLTQAQITSLVARDIIIVRDLLDSPHVMQTLHLSRAKSEALLTLAHAVIAPTHQHSKS
jgi:hypothetical protein